jgi:hypothetical protein
VAVFTEPQKVLVRHFMGFAGIFKQADPRLENAMLAICATADGGSQPDDSSQLQALAIVMDLQEIECVLKSMWKSMLVMQAGTNKIDTLRGMAGMRAEGRRVVNGLAAVLGTSPRRDIFSAATINAEGDAFYDTPGASGTGGQW